MSRTPHNSTTVVCAAISRNSRHRRRCNTCLSLSLSSALGRGMVCPGLGKESGRGRADGWSDALALPGMSPRMCGLKGGRVRDGRRFGLKQKRREATFNRRGGGWAAPQPKQNLQAQRRCISCRHLATVAININD